MTSRRPRGSTGALHVDDKSEEDDIRDFEQCGCEIGCGRCRTKRCPVRFLNCCNNAKGALLFISLAAVMQGAIVNGLVNIVISTLERRFSLQSWETGFIAACYEIGVVICIPVVTYIGGRGHRPLWLGWGIFIMGIGSIVFSIPHFVAPTYVVDTFSCTNASSVDCSRTSLRPYRGFFILGQLLHGIGASPLYTIAITYLDANVKQTSSAIYNGIFFAASVLGPGLGYLAGGAFLYMFTNPGEDVSINPLSPLWIGNWWIGFLGAGLLSILIAIPIIMYPKQLPGTDKYRLDREKEVHQNANTKDMEDENFGKSIKDAPRCALILCKVPTLMLISISSAMDTGIIASVATFGPKYIEEMFTISASDAAFYFGVATIISSCSAQIVGGIVVMKFNMTVKNMVRLCTIATFAALGCFFVFLIRCPNREFAGVNVPHNNESATQCESKCGCSTSFFNPVCGIDGLTYTSYCDAGCDVDGTSFANCTRVARIKGLENATALPGRCAHSNSCLPVALFLVIGSLGVFITFLKTQPALQASMRCVPFVQRSFAIGIQWLVVRLLGNIPLPIIMGRVLDLSCMIWSKQCGECGSCKAYDSPTMSTNMVIMIVLAKIVSLIFYILAWCTYKTPKQGKAGLNEFESADKEKAMNQGAVAMNEHDNLAFAL